MNTTTPATDRLEKAFWAARAAMFEAKSDAAVRAGDQGRAADYQLQAMAAAAKAR